MYAEIENLNQKELKFLNDKNNSSCPHIPKMTQICAFSKHNFILFPFPKPF